MIELNTFQVFTLMMVFIYGGVEIMAMMVSSVKLRKGPITHARSLPKM
jgi:hypothetical protein